MAQVDFSNAIIEAVSGTPFSEGYLYINQAAYIYSKSGDTYDPIATNPSLRRISETATKTSFVFSGTFTASGTEFYLYAHLWKVSNVNFNVGDTYNFQIDIEISVT